MFYTLMYFAPYIAIVGAVCGVIAAKSIFDRNTELLKLKAVLEHRTTLENERRQAAENSISEAKRIAKQHRTGTTNGSASNDVDDISIVEHGDDMDFARSEGSLIESYVFTSEDADVE